VADEQQQAGEQKRSWLDNLLRLFADVRGGEAPTVLLLLLNLFIAMTAYYVLKVVREPLIADTGEELASLIEGAPAWTRDLLLSQKEGQKGEALSGSVMKSLATGVQALFLMILIPTYGRFAARANRNRLIVGVVLFFIVCLELFFIGSLLDVPMLGFVFFVWLGIYSLAIIAQVWSFANDIYDREAGERLFAIVMIGQVVGPMVGSGLSTLKGLSTELLLQGSAILLLLHLFVYWVLNRRPESTASAGSTKTLAGKGGFSLVLRSPYIRLIALLFLLLNLVNTTGEIILTDAILERAKEALEAAQANGKSVSPGEFKKAFIKEQWGSFYFIVNIVTFLLQAFVASRIVKFLGVRGLLFALPIVSLGAYSTISAGVGYLVLRVAKTAENSTDYSIMNTARATIWLPTTRDEKYKAKQTIDTFIVRVGDLASTGLVFVGTQVLSFDRQSFAQVNIVMVLVWLALTYLVYREYRELAARRRTEPAPAT
jgi:AAA family ATP:ADP antiporter